MGHRVTWYIFTIFTEEEPRSFFFFFFSQDIEMIPTNNHKDVGNKKAFFCGLHFDFLVLPSTFNTEKARFAETSKNFKMATLRHTADYIIFQY
jgi:hypothetical protein